MYFYWHYQSFEIESINKLILTDCNCAWNVSWRARPPNYLKISMFWSHVHQEVTAVFQHKIGKDPVHFLLGLQQEVMDVKRIKWVNKLFVWVSKRGNAEYIIGSAGNFLMEASTTNIFFGVFTDSKMKCWIKRQSQHFSRNMPTFVFYRLPA